MPLQKELPIYGSGRLGVAFDRTGLYLKYNYEITDHLGNVRAVVSPLKSLVVATMEDEYAPIEEQEFTNLAETRATDALFNTTVGGNKVARLNATQGQVVGPGHLVKVQAGDVVRMSVMASYVEHTTSNTFVTGLAALVTSGFGLVPAGESVTAYNALSDLLAGGSLVPDPAGVPKAYLNYLAFDLEHNPVAIDQTNPPWVNVSPAAADGTAETLALEYIAQTDGYLYIYVANETQEDVDVYFDDLTITHTGISVIQSTDYYPFGLVMREEKNEPYRYGYQGQFAEMDEETGWNHFEARMWHPVIARWMSTDPARQYYSPYVGMGNTPGNAIDSDGRLIIFVNGFTFFGILKPGPAYWGTFAKAIADYYGEDYARAYFANGEGNAPAFRRLDGYVWADVRIESLKAQAIRDGRVIIASHSMGYAFAQGIEQRLKAEGIEVDLQVTYAPYEYQVLDAGDTRTYAFFNDRDWVTGWKNELQGKNVFKFIGQGGHSLSDFWWSFGRLDKTLPQGTVEVGEIIYGEFIPDGK